MLKAKKFGNREKAIKKKVILAIESQIRKQGEYIKEDIEENELRVWYLDTQRHELNRNHNFFLRTREEQTVMILP
jgi:thermostable 8-oxoguanine DNA glycosylase